MFSLVSSPSPSDEAMESAVLVIRALRPLPDCVLEGKGIPDRSDGRAVNIRL
jgi:hypothetical protein